MYYRNANCAVVVYDITQPATLEKARHWIRELQKQADSSIIIALCGNKLDLDERRAITEEDVKKCDELVDFILSQMLTVAIMVRVALGNVRPADGE